MTALPLFDKPAPVSVPPALKLQPARMALRPYQQEASDAVLKEWQSTGSTLVVMPTGTGKTVLFSHVTDQRLAASGGSGASGGGRVMVLAHREELIHQAADKIRNITGERVDVEMADYWAREGHNPARIVVSSIQTQVAGKHGGRMTRFDPADFETVIVDEAHHAVAASYRKVLTHYQQNPACKLLGVTATPDRTDEEALGQVFESVAYVYEIQDAVRDGWLAPIVQRYVEVEGLDFSQVRTTAGDLNSKDLAQLMEAEGPLHETAAPTIEIAAGRKTLVFASSVAHAELLAEIFNRHEADSARWVSGMTPKDERRAILRDYAANRFQFLVNVGVFTEGFDDPGIKVVAIARPTESRALYAQMVGRGTRPLPGLIDQHEEAEARRAAIASSDKPNVEVIDFVGNAGRHKLVCVADILGGNYPDEVVEAAAKAAREQSADGKPVNVLEQLEQSAQQESERREREKEREKRREVRAKAKYRSQNIDPFDVLAIEPLRERGWDRGKPPTERQIEYLKTKGVDVKGIETRAAATRLISTLRARQEYGWCSFKQAKLLKRFGYDPKGIRFDEASRLIDACFKGQRPEAKTSQPEPIGVESY